MSVTFNYGLTCTVEIALSAATGSYGIWDAGVWGPTISTVLNSNPYFETDLSGWTAFGSTATRSNAQAHQGSWSARVVPDGVSTNAYIEAAQVPVIGGAAYLFDGWLFSAGGYSQASVSVNWYTSSFGYISTQHDFQALTAGVWRHWSNVFVAPSNAAYAGIHAVEGGTPGAGAIFHADEIIVGNGGAQWGPDVVWTDVSQWVQRIETERRFDRQAKSWDTGRAVVTLKNQDGRFSPVNLAGPYVTGGITQIRPWRDVRIKFAYGGTTYPAYYGYAVDWKESWTLAPANAGAASTIVQCDDEFASLARFDGLEMPAAGAGETSGKRIQRVLNNAGHTGARNIDNGVMTVQATTLAANAVTELKLVADSEGGAVYVARDGAVTFENTYALIEKARSNTVQATFGDAGGELPYSDIGSEYNGDLTANIVAFARTTGTEQIVTDEGSRALYKDKRDSRTDLVCETDTQVQTVAALWLARFKDPEYRLTSVRVQPRKNPAVLFPAVLGREVRDLVRVKRQPPGGFTVQQDCFVSGISHVVTPDDFVTVFDLSSGKPFTSYVTDRWDVGKFDIALWFI